MQGNERIGFKKTKKLQGNERNSIVAKNKLSHCKNAEKNSVTAKCAVVLQTTIMPSLLDVVLHQALRVSEHLVLRQCL